MSAGIVWVEIPVLNMERALAFYNAVFQLQAEVYDDGERLSAVLWMIEGAPGLSLTKTAGFRPGLDGIWVYIHSSDPLDEVLARVEAAGGTVLSPLTSMGASGAYTLIQDTEGNTIALYTPPAGAPQGDAPPGA